MPFTPNEIFANRYRLLKKVGMGGFSEVWQAADTLAEDAIVAIKIYAPERGMDDLGLKQFKREYASVLHLSHPHILTAKHFDIHDGRPYLVMLYCEGGSLYGKLMEHGAMDEKALAVFVAQIAGALEYLHGKGIIHQDLKPDNILVDRGGDYLLTDFGISSRLRTTLQRTTVSARSMTIAYAPPERFQYMGDETAAADVFSLGVMMTELLTGKQPWGGMGGSYLRPDTELSELPAAFSKDLNTLIRQCLQYEPGKRPAAKQLKQAAELYLQKGQWAESSRIEKTIATSNKKTAAVTIETKQQGEKGLTEKTVKPIKKFNTYILVAWKTLNIFFTGLFWMVLVFWVFMYSSQMMMAELFFIFLMGSIVLAIIWGIRHLVRKEIKQAGGHLSKTVGEANGGGTKNGMVEKPVWKKSNRAELIAVLVLLVLAIISLLWNMWEANNNDDGKTMIDQALQERYDTLISQERYDTLISQGDFLFKYGQFEEARERYQEAAKFHPNGQIPNDKIAKVDEVIRQQEMEAERKKQEEADRIAEQEAERKKKEEADRIAKQKAEQEQKKKIEQERIAKQKEAEKIEQARFGTVTDIDGNTYKTVKIGNQVWMAENLRTSRYSNGDRIANPNYSQLEDLTTGAWCWYQTNINYDNVYGKLYNWYAAKDSRNVCPTGWHVPSDSEWQTLVNYLGSNAGGKMKAAETPYWHSPNAGAFSSSSSGFSGLPAGVLISGQGFTGMGYYVKWWSTTANGSKHAWIRTLNYHHGDVNRQEEFKDNGYSIRCIKN